MAKIQTFKTSDTQIEVPYNDSGVMVVTIKNTKVTLKAFMVKHGGKVTCDFYYKFDKI